ncbi:5-oxoprolinase subunit C family protein [Bacillus benzoevorans]|uniref:Antagonist of KipI n=1 Tax=Bacillus benzoevorans TaxID=1456 RepID=A0A7X0LTK7_9BACI|nr:biotin-dependent carboxyltransferase family protein [Bacillus benzoevorans]MBB6443593.1 antagonist of KipI [Bacillus benzoevorans]
MIKIIKPGLLSTIQDMGRFGFQKYGVGSSGAMDLFSHRIANILTGNNENAPTIEMTLLGAEILFQEDSLIAICGGNLSPAITGGSLIPAWRPVLVKKGTVLHLRAAKQGCRTYLAVAGGFSVPKLMNSASTYLRAEMGGFRGRALQSGDEISVNPRSTLAGYIAEYLNASLNHKPFAAADWFVSPNLIPSFENNPVIRVMEGRHYHLFSEDSKKQLFNSLFHVIPQSDRMGCRLQGPPLQLENPQELLSEAVTYGTIQVPADGNPIVLLADRQTTGGYVKMAQIASVDFPLIAQAKPGDRIHFKKISHEEAQRLYIEREKNLLQLKQGILHKFGLGGFQ